MTRVTDATYASPKSDIRGVILDYGAVLTDQPAPEKMARMAELLKLRADTFLARYNQERDRYDCGAISPAEYWFKVAGGAVALDDTLVDQLRQWDLELWCALRPEMMRWLGMLKAAGLKTALLSNMHGDMVAYARRNYVWLDRLDCAVLSCEISMIKPSSAIFEGCLDRLALDPGQALFIDDRETNIQAAKDLGIIALRFQSVELLRRDLEALEFPVLPIVRARD